MSGTILRRRDRTARPPRVEHYSSAVNTASKDRSVAFMEMHYTPKYGLFGRIIDGLVLRRFITRTLADVLDGLAQKAEAGPAPIGLPEPAAA